MGQAGRRGSGRWALSRGQFPRRGWRAGCRGGGGFEEEEHGGGVGGGEEEKGRGGVCGAVRVGPSMLRNTGRAFWSSLCNLSPFHIEK